MRWQSTWPSKDIFHEYAQRLRQEGQRHDRRRPQDRGAARRRRRAGVPTARRGIKGVLDGGHGVVVYHYGKQNALALWGSGPAYAHGRQHAAGLAQIRRRQGAARQALQVDRRQRRLVRVRPDADAAARLVPEAGHQSRTTSRACASAPSAFRSTCSRAWAPRSPRCPAVKSWRRWTAGLLDAAEFNNASSDRILGFADVSKVCMLQSYHQNAEQFEILFNKARFDALPDTDESDHLERGRGGVRRHVLEGDRPLFEGLHRAAAEGQGQVLQDAGSDPPARSSRSSTASWRRR